jgi:hypothetical protein
VIELLYSIVGGAWYGTKTPRLPLLCCGKATAKVNFSQGRWFLFHDSPDCERYNSLIGEEEG